MRGTSRGLKAFFFCDKRTLFGLTNDFVTLWWFFLTTILDIMKKNSYLKVKINMEQYTL